MANKRKASDNLKPIQKGELSSEEAKRRGSAGGKRSVEVRREKRDAKKAARYILELAAKGTQLENAKAVGASEKDGITNMEVMQARLFVMALGGNLQAYETLMKMAGYWNEENRAERESIAADERRKLEVEAKLKALGTNPEGASMAVNMGNEDGGSDVVIYIPQMLNEKDCEVTDDPVEQKDAAKADEKV